MTDTPIVSISFFRMDTRSSRAWAMGMMGAARLSLPRVPGIGFWKLCGSGKGEGFTPQLVPKVFAILCSWRDEATARSQTAEAGVFNRYRAHAAEDWTVFLETTSARGVWSGKSPFAVSRTETKGPLAALTRATVKPSRALKFWDHAPDVNRMIDNDPNVVFKIGIGEVPLLHQVTFSIWPDTGKMADFARRNGPHAEAIRAVRDGNWFAEELYARFAILGDTGTWGGSSPLEALERHA
jgi:spheroidene monooxygenase